MPGELPGESVAFVPIVTPPEALIVPVPETVPCVTVSGWVRAVAELYLNWAPEPLTVMPDDPLIWPPEEISSVPSLTVVAPV